MTKERENIYSTQVSVHLLMIVLLLLASSIKSQVDIEAVARLHFTIASAPAQWFEGFQSYSSGSYSPYQSHRSGVKRDSAYVARTFGGESAIEWNTVSIPNNWKGDSASFIWVCGFGNNLGAEWYDLKINESNEVSFLTKNESEWNVIGKNGVRLSFTAVAQNSNGANLGYMVLTVPSSFLKKGKPLKIRLSGRIAEREIWYRLFAYRNSIQHLLKNEKRNYYSNVEFIHMGDARLTFCTTGKFAGSIVKIYNADKLIAEEKLKTNGALSKSEILIPRSVQPGSNSNSIIKIAGKPVDTIFWNDINKRRIRAFMNENIVFEKYVFKPGDFPECRWQNEIMVENEIGKFPLSVKYFNSDFKKVTRADKPGRYGAVIEGVTPSGFKIKRFVTLFCSRIEFDDYSKNVPVKMNKLKDYGISDPAWEEYSKNEERYSFGSLKMFPGNDADAAVFLAGLNEIKELNNVVETPRNKDRQWWISLKRILDGIPVSQNELMSPKPIKNDSSLLLTDSVLNSSRYDKVQIEKIRIVCRQWAEKGEVPHVTLVVHKGKIIFHEAFGNDENDKPLRTDSRMWMASITKLFTGVLMMQFVEQSIIDLDEPVSRYLRELKGIGKDKLTIRNLFNHTSGLQFAGEWASDWNYSLENQIAHVLPSVEVGTPFAYHRVGYALAGKIMERITGKTIPELFFNNIFIPLGMNGSYSDNTYGGLYCPAEDLARFGQMLLNKGKYNGSQLFSEKIYEMMLPEKFPDSDRSWGIGTTPMGGNGLSNSAIGHGAASGSVFRIDPENDLVIISARNKPGKYHDEFEKLLIENITSLISNHSSTGEKNKK